MSNMEGSSADIRIKRINIGKMLFVVITLTLELEMLKNLPDVF